MQNAPTILVLGHILMAACAAFYLAWWIIFFRPAESSVEGPLYAIGVGCIVLAVISGLAGVIAICNRVSSMFGFALDAGTSQVPSGLVFAAVGAALYVLLALLTRFAFDRPITTELVLFCGWIAMEAAVVFALHASGTLPAGICVCAFVVAVAIFFVSLVCYILYYKLGPTPSFIDGCIPLAVVGIYSIVMAVFLRLYR